MRNSVLLVLGLLVFSCSDSDGSSSTDTTADGGTTDAGDSDAAASTDAGNDGAVTFVTKCGGATSIENVVCASNEYLATLSDTEKAATLFDFTNSAAKTLWSNLPGVTRNGVKLSALTGNSRAAALNVAKLMLTTQGYRHLVGVLAGDDYLNSVGGAGGGGMPEGGGGGPGGPGGGGGTGSGYGSGNYSLAIIGTPSTTGDFMIQIGGHHMAFNMTYRGGVGYPVPHHLGAEPKASFTVTGDYAGTYQPLQDKGSSMVGLFSDFTSEQMTSSYLSGQTFADVLLGPVEYGTGSLSKVVYPAQTGVQVSSLAQAQQDKVTAAIETWLLDYDPSVSGPLLAAYKGAYDQTYISYASPTEGTLDPDVNTTYIRIDGPRLWLELSCQGGVVIQGVTHFHTIYRDKTEDYGASL